MKKRMFLMSVLTFLTMVITGCSDLVTIKPSRVTTKFLNYDDTVLYVTTIPYGNDATYQGDTPTRESSASTVYTFKGWDKPLQNITTDTTFYALYSESPRQYEIKFVNYDNEVLETLNLEYNTLPSYSGETPTRDADAQYTYTFSSWSPEIERVTHDAIYVAEYTKEINSYTITWDVDSVINTETYKYGETPSYKGSTDKAKDAQYTYTFNGWEPNIEQVTTNQTYVATYERVINQYKITWVVDGVNNEEYYDYGSTPTYKGSTDKMKDAQYTYTFNGWEPNVEEVKSDATYVAQYDKTINSYTVTWDVDGVMTTETYNYGDIPSYKGTISKQNTAQYTYFFSGWSPNITNVTGDIKYTAEFNSTINSYTIIWKNYDDTVLKTETIEYGKMPVFGGVPGRDSDAQYSYEFSGWSPAVAKVVGDATYTAQYNKTLNSYTITWDVDGIKTSEVYNYGDIPSYSGNPSKEGDEQYYYTFSNWSPNITKVTGNTTYTAQFNQQINTYTVTFVNDDGTVLKKVENVEYGTSISYSGDTPTKEGNVLEYYEFAGWSPNVSTIVADTTYVATYNSIAHKYSNEWSIDESTDSHYHACLDDGYTELRNDVGKHQYSSNVIEPTYYQKGYTLHTCKVCGHSYSSDYVDSLEFSSKLTFALNDDGESYMVYGCDWYSRSTLYIPRTHDGLPVTTLGSYSCNGQFSSIFIPDTITHIGVRAIVSSYLNEIDIPDSVTHLDDQFIDFSSGQNIKITLSDNLVSLGGFTISNYQITNLNKYDNAYYIPSHSNPYFALYKFTSQDITSCEINSNCKFIASQAFVACKSLTELVVPDSVIGIGMGAFMNCEGLTYLKLGKNIKTLGSSVLSSCKSLQTLILPDEFNDNIIDNLVSGFSTNYLKTFAEYDNGYYIGSETNPYMVLVKVSKEDINSLSVHKDCKVVLSIYNKYIESVTFNEDLSAIFYGAFTGCTYLKSVDLSNTKLKKIDSLYFSGCTYLTTIKLPNSLESAKIQGWDLSTNNAAVNYNVYENGKYLGNDTNPYMVFCGMTSNSLTSCSLHSSCRFIVNSAVQNNSSLKSFTLNNNIKIIPFNCFWNCSSLVSLNSMDNVEVIEGQAFYDCTSLTTFTSPNSIIEIGKHSFMNCSKLTSLTIGKNLKRCVLGSFAITSGGESPLTIYWNAENLNLKDGWGSSLITNANKIAFGKGVKFIPNYFCYVSDSNTIQYLGTMAEWENVIKGGDRCFGQYGHEILCSDGVY